MWLKLFLDGGTEERKEIVSLSNAEPTLEHLAEEVKNAFHIASKYQYLYFNGERLFEPSTKKLKSLMVGDGSEIRVVRCMFTLGHRDHRLWVQYKGSVDAAMKEETTLDAKKKNAKAAVEIFSMLEKSKFFIAFPEHMQWWRDNHPKATICLNDEEEYIDKAAEEYFFAIHKKLGGGDSNFYFKKSKKTDGTRLGLICDVMLCGESTPTRYNVKTHHFGGSTIEATMLSGPDIKELFVYKFLEELGVGAEVEFILPTTGSETAFYIASKWRTDFKRIDQLGAKINRESVMQLYLLHCILQLYDMKSDNCGQWENDEPAIVDFFLPSFVFENPDMVKTLCRTGTPSVLSWARKELDEEPDGPYEVLESCSKEERMEMARKCLPKWRLLNILERTEAKFLRQVKGKILAEIPTRCRMDGVEIMNEESEKEALRKTTELRHYVRVIRANVRLLCEQLGIDPI